MTESAPTPETDIALTATFDEFGELSGTHRHLTELARSLERRLSESEETCERKHQMYASLHRFSEDIKAKLAESEREVERLKAWLDSNTMFYETAGQAAPALAAHCKRIWYHATDDTQSFPFSVVAAAARGEQPK